MKINNKLEHKNIEIIIDGSRLRKSLFQIMNNAVKFTEKGFVELSCEAKGDKIRFCIKDSGIGIEEDDIEHVFSIFRKGKQGEKLYSGTGLGLSIAKSSVEGMGGKIWLESEVKKGTSVFFELPLKIHKQD